MQNNISVIINAGDVFEGLEKVLFGFNAQTYRNFEMLIVQNTESDVATAAISRIKDELFYPVAVITAPNGIAGALAACTTGYIITVGMCIPRHDFVEQHIKYREEGYYLTAGALDVDAVKYNAITREAIYSGRCFPPGSKGLLSSILNTVIPAKQDWNNDNSSGWIKDLSGVFPENEASIPTRALHNSGIKPKQIGFTTICLKKK